MFLDQSSTAAPDIYTHPLSDCCLSSLLSCSWWSLCRMGASHHILITCRLKCILEKKEWTEEDLLIVSQGNQEALAGRDSIGWAPQIGGLVRRGWRLGLREQPVKRWTDKNEWTTDMTTAWQNLRNTTLSKGSQTQKKHSVDCMQWRCRTGNTNLLS